MRTATISPVRRVADRSERLAEQRPGAFGRSEVCRRKHGEHDRVIATDLDEGHASVDQARDHVGELLIAPGDEDGSVSAEISFQQSIGFLRVASPTGPWPKRQSAPGFLPAPPCQIRTRSRQQLPQSRRAMPALILTVLPVTARGQCPFQTSPFSTLASFVRRAIEGFRRPSWQHRSAVGVRTLSAAP
ncbi:hypothetical protein NKJ88_00225 [Mesorhizobium sp. M0016]|uniref:hypothetical protein n=1 Tax=Mesorhizobium sp. M0016 TaxID=2956843 RepID=UPI00333DF844